MMPASASANQERDLELEVERLRVQLREAEATLAAARQGAASETPPQTIEAALRKSNAHLEATLNALPDLMFELGSDGIFRSFRAARPELLLAPPESFLGKTVDQVLPAEAAQIVSRALAETSACGTSFGTVYSLALPEGQRWFELSMATEDSDPDTSERSIIVLVRDITDRKRTEDTLRQLTEELKRSNAELEQFAYVASHDLQEPLRAISGMVQLLRQRYHGQLDARADEYIQHAIDGADRMQILINDLLALSRVGTRRKPFSHVDTAAVLAIAIANLGVTIRESGALVTHTTLPTVIGDAAQLTQLFQNLVGNALKFRGEQPPRIQIGAERTEQAWRFSVRDNGIGIDPQYFERIFLVFQRLHTRREYAGTGIGLALCKKIVERHSGQIWVESQPGQGSVFLFTLPDRSDHDVS